MCYSRGPALASGVSSGLLLPLVGRRDTLRGPLGSCRIGSPDRKVRVMTGCDSDGPRATFTARRPLLFGVAASRGVQGIGNPPDPSCNTDQGVQHVRESKGLLNLEAK